MYIYELYYEQILEDYQTHVHCKILFKSCVCFKILKPTVSAAENRDLVKKPQRKNFGGQDPTAN